MMGGLRFLVAMLLVLSTAETSWSEVKLNVGRSASDLNEAGEPARFHVTWPKDATTTWSFDIAATAAGLVTDRLYLGPTVEYHRHTQIDSPQDAFRLGATSILVLGDISRGAAAHVQTLAAYQRHAANETTAHGVLALVAATPLLNSLAIDRRLGPDEFKVRWRPGFGLEYQGGASTGQAFSSTLRGNAKLHLDLFPADTYLRRRLQVAFDFEGWLDFAESQDDGSLDRRSIFSSSATVYLDEGRRFGASVEYVNGENPRDGLEKQAFLAAAFVFRLGDAIP